MSAKRKVYFIQYRFSTVSCIILGFKVLQTQGIVCYNTNREILD